MDIEKWITKKYNTLSSEAQKYIKKPQFDTLEELVCLIHDTSRSNELLSSSSSLNREERLKVYNYLCDVRYYGTSLSRDLQFHNNTFKSLFNDIKTIDIRGNEYYDSTKKWIIEETMRTVGKRIDKDADIIYETEHFSPMSVTTRDTNWSLKDYFGNYSKEIIINDIKEVLCLIRARDITGWLIQKKMVKSNDVDNDYINTFKKLAVLNRINNEFVNGINDKLKEIQRKGDLPVINLTWFYIELPVYNVGLFYPRNSYECFKGQHNHYRSGI